MSHLHRRQESSLADEESIPARSGPCHFQLAGSSVPSSVSVTGSSGSHCEPATSINPEPQSSPALRWGTCLCLPTHSLLPKQEHSTEAGKAACAEVFRSITAWEGEGESYVNNHKGRSECSDVTDGCWCRRCSCSTGRRTPRATGHFYSFLFNWIPPEWTSLYLLGNNSLEVTKASQAHFWWLSSGNV